jgi:hypothetical protein
LPPNARYITFNVTGTVIVGSADTDNGVIDPDGFGGYEQIHCTGANGISGILSYGTGFLTGVFLNAERDATQMHASPTLDYRQSGTDFRAFSPTRNMQFFIGDGLADHNSGTQQVFRVPHKATKLFLGIPDCHFYAYYANNVGYYNDNSGAFTVEYAVTFYSL